MSSEWEVISVLDEQLEHKGFQPILKVLAGVTSDHFDYWTKKARTF